MIQVITSFNLPIIIALPSRVHGHHKVFTAFGKYDTRTTGFVTVQEMEEVVSSILDFKFGYLVSLLTRRLSRSIFVYCTLVLCRH